MTLKEMKERRAAIFATEIDAAKTDEELDTLQTELRKLDMMIAKEECKAAPAFDPKDPDGRTALVNNPDARTIPAIAAAGAVTQTRTADAEGMEYRKAFMDHVMRGTPIPAELRADANTLTSDVSSVIPTVLVNRIITQMKSLGMILPLITRTSFPAGVNVPTSSVRPVATWVGEGKSSDRQKTSTGVITFTHHKLRCEVSLSMEVSVMSISAFEDMVVEKVSEGMIEALEGRILSTSDGTLSVRGIFAETPAAGQALTPDALDYETLIEAEAALPQAYEGGAVWCMTKKTFMAFVGMTDATGQPIARVNYGIGGKPERTLLGRTVVLCGDYMPNYSESLPAGTVYACLFNFRDYVLNTVYNMGIQRKQDWDTEDMLTKAVMAVDGKVVDKNSLVTLANA